MARLTLNDQIIEFIAEQTGIKRERLSLEKTLFGDLGVDGQDGWELMDEFGKRFKVDISCFRANMDVMKGPNHFQSSYV